MSFSNRPRWVNLKGFFRWCSSFAAPPLIAGLLTAIYIYSKTHGGASLATIDPYKPVYSWDNFIASNATFVGELFFAQRAITPAALLALWAVVFIYAFIDAIARFSLWPSG